ncbi:MAG TPA: helix-turn-helix domain-containing protein [Thermoanaerobaculia bacterium]|nr:helix-turn-helix domain-containing protein [Thermoanaerobaculia bacterium]
MTEPENPEVDNEPSGENGGEELLTLTEVSNRTGISMPTLQRYKKEYQSRLPTVGRGRRQRYRASALEVFEEIKRENISRRGRPRKEGSPRREPRPERQPGLLTLTEISERTNISYPTLVRYVKQHGDRIPYEGEGRRRRYHPEAVAVFQEIRGEGGRGRRAGGGGRPAGNGNGGGTAAAASDGRIAQRVASLERSQARLERLIRDLLDELRKPMTVTLRRGR